MAKLNFDVNGKALEIDNVPMDKVERVTNIVTAKIARSVSAEKILADIRQYQTAPRASVTQKMAKRTPISKVTNKILKGPKVDNLREKVLELIKSLNEKGVESGDIVKAVQNDFKISYANAYYYWSRVYKKSA